ncbi:MAG TPA: DinB family protein [Thermomicrobiales bacterium]|nr:DinB family protein [Thermomicrobiales bacterium]
MTASQGSITASTLAFASALAMTSDDALTRDWPAPSPPGGFWYGYEDNAREVTFRIYQQLRDLATEIEITRTPATEAQHILAQHQFAYRDLTGALAGVRDDEFDRAPDEKEWPLRTVLYHIGLTERGFHALIHWAVARRRAGDTLPIEMPDDHRDAVSDPIVESGTLGEVLQRFDALHQRVLNDFTNLDSTDLDAPNVWWEGYEIPARFRLHRFDAHLREHTIQVDKTLAGIDHPPSEPQRLARLIHRALGQVEGCLLGAPDTCMDQQQSIAESIAAAMTGLQ